MSMVIWLTVLVLFTAAPYTAQVVAVHDGDTVTVKTTEVIKIRMAGMDAPELKQSYGPESQQALSKLLLNKQVLVKPEVKDRYGRTVARLELDGNDAAYQLENAVLAGTTPVPTREEFIAALPVLGWAL